VPGGEPSYLLEYLVGSDPPHANGNSRVVEGEGNQFPVVARKKPGRLAGFVIDVLECEIGDPALTIPLIDMVQEVYCREPQKHSQQPK
jgi:hypothetical protein